MFVNRAVLVLLVSGPGLAFAWCPVTLPSIEDEFRQSKFVVVGEVLAATIVDREANGTGGMNYRITVDEVLRGRLPKNLTVFSENSSGSFPMKKDQKYILFVGSEKVEAFPHAVYTVNNCGRSGALLSPRKC